MGSGALRRGLRSDSICRNTRRGRCAQGAQHSQLADRCVHEELTSTCCRVHQLCICLTCRKTWQCTHWARSAYVTELGIVRTSLVCCLSSRKTCSLACASASSCAPAHKQAGASVDQTGRQATHRHYHCQHTTCAPHAGMSAHRLDSTEQADRPASVLTLSSWTLSMASIASFCACSCVDAQ